MAEMTSLERSLRTLRLEQPDRVPVIPQAHTWVAYNYGSSNEELMYNGRLYAELQLAGWRDFGWDGVFVATDSVALAHSLGLEVMYTDLGAAPSPEGILKSLRQVDELEVPDPRQTRLNEWITATRILAEQAGEKLLVIGRADQGAFTLAAQLRGMQDFLLEVGLNREPEQIHRLLEFCNRYILTFANLLLDAGAHVVTIGDALASGSLVSPAVFEEYAFPYQRALVQAVARRGRYFSIHVCGKTTRVMPYLVQTGAHIIEFDAPTDFDTAWQVARGKTCLLGNVDTSEVMAFGSPQKVKEECRWRLAKVLPHSGYILSSGCAISPNAPADNLHAMVESAQQYGQYG